MEKTIPFGKDLKTPHAEALESLKQSMPFLFDLNGGLNLKAFENFVNEYKETEPTKFEFTWSGKEKGQKLAFEKYDSGTLEVDGKRGKNHHETENVIIEGENLQVLHLLRKSYKGKVKCIYIDPPYNTGNDFVYKDNFELDIKRYLIESGQIHEETGEMLVDYITKDDGKKHSKWLSFMYPRLLIVRDLLTEDGVIFVSIDDNEQANLKLLMSEIFGEENFVEQIIWKKKEGGGQADRYFVKEHEYIFCFRKDDNFEIEEMVSEINEKEYNKNDENGKFKIVKLAKWGNTARKEDRPSMHFPIIAPNGEEVHPIAPDGNDGRWRVGKATMQELIEKKLIYWDLKNGKYIPYEKFYLEEAQKKILKTNTIFQDVGTNADSSKELTELFGKKDIFDNPKPTSLIKHLLKISTKAGDLVLDFFAGSGTTGQAVMELNYEETEKKKKEGMITSEEEVGGRKFILVQLPEKIDPKKEAFKAGFKFISDITIERVRRASEKYKGIDNGFKVFQLYENPNSKSKTDDLFESMDSFILNLISLYYGYGLNYKLQKFSFGNVYEITSEFEERKALVILENNLLSAEILSNLIKLSENANYTIFAKEACLNIEIVYNLCNYFKKEDIIKV